MKLSALLCHEASLRMGTPTLQGRTAAWGTAPGTRVGSGRCEGPTHTSTQHTQLLTRHGRAEVHTTHNKQACTARQHAHAGNNIHSTSAHTRTKVCNRCMMPHPPTPPTLLVRHSTDTTTTHVNYYSCHTTPHSCA